MLAETWNRSAIPDTSVRPRVSARRTISSRRRRELSTIADLHLLRVLRDCTQKTTSRVSQVTQFPRIPREGLARNAHRM
ncbi:hypothetical protein JCM9957A_65180 [Kineosporia succinea]